MTVRIADVGADFVPVILRFGEERGAPRRPVPVRLRSEEHMSELQSQFHLVCRLLLEKKKRPRPSCFRAPRCGSGCRESCPLPGGHRACPGRRPWPLPETQQRQHTTTNRGSGRLVRTTRQRDTSVLVVSVPSSG